MKFNEVLNQAYQNKTLTNSPTPPAHQTPHSALLIASLWPFNSGFNFTAEIQCLILGHDHFL